MPDPETKPPEMPPLHLADSETRSTTLPDGSLLVSSRWHEGFTKIEPSTVCRFLPMNSNKQGAKVTMSLHTVAARGRMCAGAGSPTC